MTTVFCPDSESHCFFKSLRTSTPVRESRAPVGSSQSNNNGSLAMARAIETLCCSPPDN